MATEQEKQEEADRVAQAALDKEQQEGVEAFASGFKGESEEGGRRPRPEAEKEPVEGKGGEDTTGAKDGASSASNGDQGKDGEAVEVEAVAPKYVQITEEDYAVLRAGADKAIRLESKVNEQFARAFGTMGSLKQAIDKLTNDQGEIDAKELEQLEKDFPELGAQLKKILVRAPRTKAEKEAEETELKKSGLSEEQIEALVKKREVEAKVAEIEDEHPGWRETVGPLDSKVPFRLWLDKQGETYKNRVNSTKAPRVIIEALDKFKADQAKPPAEKPSTNGGTTKPRQDKPDPQARRDLIASAVTPRGVGTTQPRSKTEQEHFQEGFKVG